MNSGLTPYRFSDTSGGIGEVPHSWPKQYQGVYCWYARGLGPDTIESELKRIAEVVDDSPIWIDMETRIRSLQDRKFNLKKVERCLSLTKPYVV